MSEQWGVIWNTGILTLCRSEAGARDMLMAWRARDETGDLVQRVAGKWVVIVG